MLAAGDVVQLVTKRLLPALEQERSTRLDEIDRWYRWDHEHPRLPAGATPELKALLKLSQTPWLGLVVTTVAQTMYVDGYRSPASDDDMPPWALWTANDMDSRQTAIHRAMLAYGHSYATALPGVDWQGRRTAVLRGVSPRRMLAFYEDPAEDDWPVYAVRQDRGPLGGQRVRLYDDEAVYTLTSGDDGALAYQGAQVHGLGFCPVVRYTNMLDLEGRSPGEVEPHIGLAKRIDKTTYDRLLAQHFSSWVVRTVSGMVEPDTKEEADRQLLRLRQTDLLVADDPDTKFGTLAATPLDGFIKAYETDIKTLAAATQTPVYALVGDLINLSADALAGARASADAKSAERRKTAGKAHEQLLRAGSLVMGDETSGHDVMAHVTWADTSIRSMASAADALGKLATMLGVPPKGLWPLIPGVSRTMIEEWIAMAEQPDQMDRLLAELVDGQAAPPAPEPTPGGVPVPG